jgi:hypothetical protein
MHACEPDRQQNLGETFLRGASLRSRLLTDNPTFHSFFFFFSKLLSIHHLAMYDHEIDPSGDAVIILRPSKEPFALWKSRPAIEDLWNAHICGALKNKKEGAA